MTDRLALIKARHAEAGGGDADKQWLVAEVERLRELDKAHVRYEKLLVDELNDFAGLVFVHGFTSSRIEAGKECRKQIKEIRGVPDEALNSGDGAYRP